MKFNTEFSIGDKVFVVRTITQAFTREDCNGTGHFCLGSGTQFINSSKWLVHNYLYIITDIIYSVKYKSITYKFAETGNTDASNVFKTFKKAELLVKELNKEL